MRLSVQNWIVKKRDDIRVIDMLADAGFEYVDWDLQRYYLGRECAMESADECRTYNQRLREEMDKKGISCCQTHSLFPTYMDDKNELEVLTSMENCFLATSELGAPYTVVHPMMPKKWEGADNRTLRVEKNIAFYNEMGLMAEKYDVTICLENMFGYPAGIGKYNETACSRVEEIEEILDGLDHRESFGVCFDLGHANLLSHDEIERCISTLGGDIKILHLHDNDGIVDWHSVPGKGNVDWDTAMRALMNIGYDGIYNFELAPTQIGNFAKQKKLGKVHDLLVEFLARYE